MDPSGAPARARPARRVHDGAVGSVRGRTVPHVQGLQELQTISGGKAPEAFIFFLPLLKPREKKILDSLYPFSIEKYARCAKCAAPLVTSPFRPLHPLLFTRGLQGLQTISGGKVPGAFIFSSPLLKSREKKILDSLYPFSIEKYARCAKCAAPLVTSPFRPLHPLLFT